MKTLIIYDSKYGTTEDAARILAKEMGAELHKAGENISPDGFDTVIIGSSIYVGQMRKPVKEYCKRFEKQLLGKRLGFFLMHGRPLESGIKDLLRANIPPALVDKAETGDFGGELRVDKMGFIDKKITSMIEKTDPNAKAPSIDQDAIKRFATGML